MTDVVMLPEKLDLKAAAPLADMLKTKMNGDLALDGSEVAHIGALCVQVLLSAAKSASDLGHKLTLKNLPDAAQDQLALLGISLDELNGAPQ